jgi:CheY-like chemotaxis protein
VGKRILLVEDNADNREAMIELFGLDTDYVVSEAVSGEDAVKLAEAQEFDLIIMDIGLPGMDGYEATRQIRTMGVKIPVVGLTAHAFSENRDRAERAGFTAFETKPIRFNLLLEKLNKIMEEHGG